MTIAAESDGASSPTRLEGKTVATVVCWFLGMGSLVSWNSMLTISDYYYELFPDYHPARVLTLVYQPFAVGAMAILAYHEAKVDTRKRNLVGYILFFLSTLGLLLLDLATSGKGGLSNYIGVCVLVACFGLADASCQGGMVGDLSFMLPEFLQSFFAGLAASGVLTSALRLMTKAVFDKTDDGLRKGVILFLSIAAFLEFLCIFLYAYTFPKLPIVKYYRSKAAAAGSKTVSADLAAAGIQTAPIDKDVAAKNLERLSNKELFIKNIDYALDLFLIYVLTLSIFPGFLYENTGHHQLGSWYALVLIAMYNVWDIIGRYVPLLKSIKLESRKGLTNGYLTVCVITTAPKGYTGPEQNALGNLLVLSLLAGIFTGVCLDWLWIIGNGTF
ncbi:hypothetical protein Leryth_019618 [Lithospermum erythrorhizon]|nr:hypothetical protein Leryth_019618 [Lithospermum erythrorhizon]